MTFTVGRRGANHADGIAGGHAGHLQIHEDDVRLQAANGVARLVAVAGLADDDELAAIVIEQRAQAFANDAVIVDEQQLDGGGHGGHGVIASNGMRIHTVVPRPGCD